MTIQVKAHKENQKTYFTITDADIRMKKGVHIALCNISKDNTTYAKKLIIDPPKTGRRYLIEGSWHRASAPMEPPAARTRNLVRNTVSIVTGHTRMEIGYTVLYGKFLENGTVKREARWESSGRSGGKYFVGAHAGITPRPVLSRVARVKGRSNVKELQVQVNKIMGAF